MRRVQPRPLVFCVILVLLFSWLSCGDGAQGFSTQATGAGAGGGGGGGGGSSSQLRSLKQQFAQFSPLQDTQNAFGGWGGSWVLTPPPQASPAAQQQGAGVNGRRNGGRTAVRSSRQQQQPFTTTTAQDISSSSSSSSSNRPIPGSSTTGGGGSGMIVQDNARVAAAPSRTTTNLAGAGVAGSSSSSSRAGNAAAGNAAGTAVTVDVTSAGGTAADAAAAAEIDALYLSRAAGVVNARTPPRIYNPAVLADLPRFNASSGAFASGSDVALWPSINPGSRVDAVFLEPNVTTPPPDTVRVLDPNPVNVVRLPAASFESGYCVPRQAYLVVNVTALNCASGSNLTRWDGEPVCARLDCTWRARGTNTMNSASGCRTVVQRPTPACPAGCNIIEQQRWNSTVNRTQLLTKCSCRAGNQACPGSWTACTCYEGLSARNLTRAFVVCSETQGECDRKCNLAVSGENVGLRLAPLCPALPDPFLSTEATQLPAYPLFGYNMASQARQSAALNVAATGRRLTQQLVGLGRRLSMVTADWQWSRLGAANQPQQAVQAEGNAAGAASVRERGLQDALRHLSWAGWVTSWARALGRRV